jgi:hypothetical protein
MSQEKSNCDSTSIVFVMDSSGSMEEMGDEPVQGLNNFYTKQKESGDFTSTLVFFNENVTFHHKNIVGKDVPILKNEEYYRGGMTALYDAIGQAIEYQKSIKIKNVIFVILTDGLENASIKYGKKTILKMIKKMEKEHEWLFMYLGANQDSFEVSAGLGINNSANYDYSPLGCMQAMRSISENVSRCVSHDLKPAQINSECLKIKEDEKEKTNKRILNSPIPSLRPKKLRF